MTPKQMSKLCDDCGKRIDCIVSRKCLLPWQRTWVWRYLESGRFSILEESLAHQTLEHLSQGKAQWGDIVGGRPSAMYVAQLLVTGLIEKRPPVVREWGFYFITKLGREALARLGPLKPPEFFIDLCPPCKFRRKRVKVNVCTSRYWADHFKRVYW